MKRRQVNEPYYQKRTGASITPTASALGRTIVAILRAHPEIHTWLFSGPLGAGKSTGIRAYLRARGVRRRVPSPTFTLVQSYRLHDGRVHHYDAYRIRDAREWAALGIEEHLASPHEIVCVEWPERLRGWRWGRHGHIRITIVPGGRSVSWRVTAK